MQSWIRNLLYLAALSLLSPWLLWRNCKTGRYRASWKQQLFGFTSHPDADSQPTPNCIWMHGVSVGEIQMLAPLLRLLQSRWPTASLAVSTTTDSGMQLAQKLMPENVRLFYFPLDFSWAVERTLKTLKPSLIVLGELELWPNLIDAAKRSGVPLAVINGRLSANSFAGYSRFSWLTKSMFSNLSLVAAQDNAHASRFRQCGAPSQTIVTGSLKFDNVSFDRECESVVRLRQLVGLGSGQRVIVMGSTQAPEEMAAMKAWDVLRGQFPDLKLLIVPRHPDRFDQVYQQIRGSQARVVRRSELQTPLTSDQWDVLLVDTIGELKWWWAMAEIAVVGGSFGSRGGQNMLEPAAYGVNVAFGPQTSNFRDIVDILLAADAATQLESLEQLTPWLRRELEYPHLGRERGERAREVVRRHQGAMQRTVTALAELLGDQSSPPWERSESNEQRGLGKLKSFPADPARVTRHLPSGKVD